MASHAMTTKVDEDCVLVDLLAVWPDRLSDVA